MKDWSDSDLAEFIRVGSESEGSTPMIERAKAESALRAREKNHVFELQDRYGVLTHPSDRGSILRAFSEIIANAPAPDRVNDGRIMFHCFAVAAGARGFLWPENDPTWNFGLRRSEPVSLRVIEETERDSRLHHEKKREWIQFPIDDYWVLMNSSRVPTITQDVSSAEILLPDGLHYSVSHALDTSVTPNKVYSYSWIFTFEPNGEKHIISTGTGHNHASALAAACLAVRSKMFKKENSATV